MSWQMAGGDGGGSQWTSNMGMHTMPQDMNMAGYTPEQWAALQLQQQNWQQMQWTQWQQYSQWHSQYGDKFAQMQAGQPAVGMPPLPMGGAPPVPPPPDQPPPPPPPHENNQPLYGNNQPQPPASAPRNTSQYSNTKSATGNNQWSYGTAPKEVQSTANKEALKSLTEEEKNFDVQFQKWEEEIERWRKENVNHPDKQAYREYEEKFELARAQLLERRKQMELRRARLLNNAPAAANSTPGNKPTMVPAPSNNSQTFQQNNQNLNKNNSYQQDSYNQSRNNSKNIDPQDRYESYNNKDTGSLPAQKDTYPSAKSDPATFLPTTSSGKSIPGLDLVPDSSQSSKNPEVIDITDEPKEIEQAPDYSTISKGINNILGDAKIMNILSMVQGNLPKTAQNVPPNEPLSANNQNYQPNPSNRNQNNFDQGHQYGNRQNMSYNRQGPNFPGQQNMGMNSQYQQQQNMYDDDDDQNMSQSQFNDRNEQYGGSNKRGGYDMRTGNMRMGGPDIRQGGPDMRQYGPDMGQGAPNMRQGGPGMRQGGPNMGQGAPGMGQGGPGMRQEGPGMRQEGPGMRQEGPVMRQEGPGIRQGGPGMGQGGPRMGQGGPGIGQGGPGIGQGGPGMGQGGPGMGQGGPGMGQGGPGMGQRGPGMRQGGPGIAQGGPGLGQTGPGIGQGGPGMGQSGTGMGQGGPGMRQGGAGMGQGGPGMGHGGPGMGQAGPGMGQSGSGMRQGGPGMGQGGAGMGQGGPGMGNGGPGMGQGGPGTRQGGPGMGLGGPGTRPGGPGMGQAGPGMGQGGPGMGQGRSDMNQSGSNTMLQDRSIQGGNNGSLPSLLGFNARPPLQDMDAQQNVDNFYQERPVGNNEPNVNQPQRQKWEEPIFAPSLVVDYDHKPLRLKGREFIEPVHTFDYNHKSKDGDLNKKKDFEKEVDELFTRMPRRDDTGDRYVADLYYRDYERRGPREDVRDIRDARDMRDARDLRDCRDFRDGRDDYRDDFRSMRVPRDVPRELPREDFERRRYDDRYDDRRRDESRDYRRDDRRDDRRDERRDDRERFSRRDDLRDRDRDRDVYRPRDDSRSQRDSRDRRDDHNRSRSKEVENRKRGLSKENDATAPKKAKETKVNTKKHVVMIDDILEPPGREMRPEKLVIILRGLPGSGKSYLAKLIRDREAENGGTARIMSIDDYFMQEGETEEKDSQTGKMVKKPYLRYEYDEAMEETYLTSLKRAFKRSLSDGYFNFLIYDAVNDQLKNYADIWNFARQNGFQAYVCTMEADIQTCYKRNIHDRKLEDLEVIKARFFETPSHHIQLDATTLLQSASIQEVQMEDVEDDVIMEDIQEVEVESVFTSKWEKMDDANQLARLDGTSKPLRSSQLSMADYLQLDEWKPNEAKPGKKTVRWADIEERREQEKMRAIGFVVGQTDWNRMNDPTMGSSALTQTKFIERVRRH